MRIRIIDAFTDRPFTGNPAAVCLLDAEGWPDESWMQHVAAEVNLPETAFAHPLTDGAEADWRCAGSLRPSKSTCAGTPRWPRPTG